MLPERVVSLGPLAVPLLLILAAMPMGLMMSSFPSASGAVVEEPFVDDNGLMWASALKVTDNDLDDQNPSIQLGLDGKAEIVYQESGADYMWARVDPPSTVVHTDKRLQTGYIPTQYQIKNESTPQPTEFFEVGPDGALHIIWTEGGMLDNRYQKFDTNGQPLTGVIQMDQITDLSRLPFLGVGNNGRAYIAFENEGTAVVQMTYVDPEGFVRSPSPIGMPGENVAFVVGPDGMIHLFYRSLGANVNMFHVKLDPDRKPVVPNGILFSNKSLVANPFSSMPTMTITPNGHVHLLMSDTTIAPLPIFYIELDENGTPLMDFVKIAEGSYGFGDIIAEPDNGVYAAWSDIIDGEIHYRYIKDGVPGKSTAITNTGGKARYPQIACDDSRGDLHLAYVDTNDGDGEIFYRYANSFRIGLQVRGIEKVRMVHLGGDDVELDIEVMNIADVPNNVTLSALVDYHGLQSHGWSFELKGTVVKLSPGGSETIPAVLKVPTWGDNGEGIDITILAEPARSAERTVRTVLTSKLTISHLLEVSGPTEFALKQKVSTLPVKVMNRGDLDETLYVSVDGGMTGWSIVPIGAGPVLGPGNSTLVQVEVVLPDGQAKDEVVPITVMVASLAVPSVNDTLDVSLITYPTKFPQMRPVELLIDARPGTRAYDNLDIFNDGELEATFDVTAALVWATGEWPINIINPRLTVAPGAIEHPVFETFVPKDAQAGLGLVVDVYATEIHGSMRDRTRVKVTVVLEKGLEVSGGGYAVAVPGETASFSVLVRNLGNNDRDIELSVQTLPEGWRWHYGLEEGTSLLTVEPYSTIALMLFVAAPDDAPQLTQMVRGFITSGGIEYWFYANITVRPVYNFVLDATYPIAKGVLGSSVTFNITVANEGTAEDEYSLSVGELPLGVSYLYTTAQGGQAGIDKVRVPSGSQRSVYLRLSIPERMKWSEFGFTVCASSIMAGVQAMDLIVELRLADLRIKDVIFDDEGLKDGDVRDVKVQVANNGDADAKNVSVGVNGLMRIIEVPAGSERDFVFKLKCHSDDLALVAVVDPLNNIQEKREDNNDMTVELTVQRGLGKVPGFDAVWLICSICLIVVLTTTKWRHN